MSNDLVERASQYISKNHTSDTDVRRSKAREWNLAHERWPNKILKWDSASKTYKPTSSTQSESSIDESELEVLQEISIRTIGLGASMMKHGQFAKNIKQQAAKMKNLASTLSQTDSDDVRWKTLGSALDAFADYMIQHSNMSRAQNFTTSIGSLGADRSVKILKKLEKRKR